MTRAVSLAVDGLRLGAAPAVTWQARSRLFSCREGHAIRPALCILEQDLGGAFSSFSAMVSEKSCMAGPAGVPLATAVHRLAEAAQRPAAQQPATEHTHWDFVFDAGSRSAAGGNPRRKATLTFGGVLHSLPVRDSAAGTDRKSGAQACARV